MQQTPESSSQAIEETTSAQFKIGGRNETSVIRGLTHINGVPIAELEQGMHPSTQPWAAMESVYLAAGESLLEVLAKDNDFVLSQGLTHQELAEALRGAWKLAFSPTYPKEIEYQGERYGIFRQGTVSFATSPFWDDVSSNEDLVLTHKTTGKKISFGGLLIHLINAYGFYEGSVEYRIEPADIIAIFPHLQNRKPAVQ